MKPCGRCNISKDLISFGRDKHTASGLRSYCRICVSETRHAKLPKEQRTKYDRKYYAKAGRANKARYDYLKSKSCPKWLSKDQKDHIKAYYQLAALLETSGYQKFDVDHVIPLNGKDVCGLHVPWNLQILDRAENIKKSNKLCI